MIDLVSILEHKNLFYLKIKKENLMNNMKKDKINKVISVYNYKKRFFLEFDEEQGGIIADNIAESLKRKEHVEVSFDRVSKVSFVFITSMLGKLLICHGFSVEELEEYIFYTGLNVGIEAQIEMAIQQVSSRPIVTMTEFRRKRED